MRNIDRYLLIKNRQNQRFLNRQQKKVLIRPLGLGLLAIILILFSIALLGGGLVYSSITADLPTLDQMPLLLNPMDGELLQPTIITDRSGEVVLFTLENPSIVRRYLAVNPEIKDHFSPQLLRAVVTKLEPDFWQSPGYSLENWKDPTPVTIAERLASELLLWQEPLSTKRAVRMRILAGQLVSRYGRTQVLEWYLNSVYFGHQAFGAESAAQLYFDKSATDLSLAESAVLAQLIDSPALNPLDAPGAILESQRQFLAQMAETMAINMDEFSAALIEPLHFRSGIQEAASLTPAFTRQLLSSLEGDFPMQRLGRGGLVVQSSLDYDLQFQFTCTIQTQLKRLQKIDGSMPSDCPAALLLPTQVFDGAHANVIAAAGVVLDPQNGTVLAYLEPRSYDGSLINDKVFEPGSLLAPFVAVSGFSRGLSPSSMFWDIPSVEPTGSVDLTNPDGTWHGPVSLRSALANNYTATIATVARQVGSENAWSLASALGMSSMNKGEDSEELLFSGGSVSLLETAAAFGTLANSGIRSGKFDGVSAEIKPNLVITVKSLSGRLLLDGSNPNTSAVLSMPLSYLINHVLSDENARWPSLGYPNPLEIGQTVAAKIGETSDHQQVWTVGYTPQRLILVWIGNQDQTDQSSSLDPLMSAGVWHAMMKQSLPDLPANGWSMPEGVSSLQVCVPSGMLPSVDCPSTMQEVFVNGNEPTRVDSLYEKIKVNRETGQRATVFTDPALVEERLFMNIPNDARAWAITAGLPVAPTGYDAIPATQVDPEVNISSPAMFSTISQKVIISGTVAGDNIERYTLQIGEGINPSSWQQIGSGTQSIKNGVLGEWDTSGLDGLFAIRLSVIDQNQSVRSATNQVSVDNTPPNVIIQYPSADQEITPVNGQVTLLADIQDNGGIQQVEWWLDGKLAATQRSAPFFYKFSGESGDHSLKLIATDNAGNQNTTNEIDFSIVK